MQLAQEILHYWFGEADDPGQQISKQSSLWWGKSLAVDKEIKTRFGAALDLTGSDDLQAWKNNASDWLALIILLDQFSRNIFRDEARAFAQDALALTLCKEGIELGVDLDLNPLLITVSLLSKRSSQTQVAPVGGSPTFSAADPATTWPSYPPTASPNKMPPRQAL